MQKNTTMSENDNLLNLLVGSTAPSAEQFRKLVVQLTTYDILVKVFVLEGTPVVFGSSPMKYVIFKEQVADRFSIGSQDVRIVGSARLGFSPSPTEKFGKPFAEASDVDVVLVSEKLFHHGSREIFRYVNSIGPAISHSGNAKKPNTTELPSEDWRTMKDAVRNYTYQNFNPGVLPHDNPLRREVFEKISSTAGLFLALEPKVFVSKIRCRVFRDWRAAEDYYTNSLRELSLYLEDNIPSELDEEEPVESVQAKEIASEPVSKEKK